MSTTEDTYTPEQFDEFDRWIAAHDAAHDAATRAAALIAERYSVPFNDAVISARRCITAAIRSAKEGTP